MNAAVETATTPDQCLAVIYALRSNGERMPSRESRLAALIETARRWRRPDDARRKKAAHSIGTLTGLAPSMIDAGLEHLLAGFTAERLTGLIDESAGSEQVRLLISAGNVPALALPDLAAALLNGAAVLLRPSSHDPETPRLFVETLCDIEPRLAEVIAVAAWPREADAISAAAAGAVDCVMVSGDDGTVARFAQRARRIIGHGEQRSLALVGAEQAAAADLSDQLARDVAWYEQQGCLSPHLVYVEGAASSARRFAERLADALARRAEQWPPAPMPLAAAGAIMQLRAEVEFREPAGAVVHGRAGAGTVLYDPESSPRRSPGRRTIWVKPLDDMGRIAELLRPWRGQIASIGTALSAKQLDAMRRQLAPLGPIFWSSIGRMQEPPIDWQRHAR